MQYDFWDLVVAGGILVDYKISAKLLRHSLVPFGKDTSNLIIKDNEIVNKIIANNAFIKKINSIIRKYGKDVDYFNTEKADKFKGDVEFDDADLFYSLHRNTINLKAKKKSNSKWDLKITIIDKYDFTDLKNYDDFINSSDFIIKSLFSSLINNYAISSSLYGVIKPYDITIEFTIIDYEVK